MGFLNNAFKRIIDLILGFTALCMIAPFWFIIAFLIKRDDPSGPVFYNHTRVGKNEKPFTCFKFRTMYTDAHSSKLAEADDDPRIFPVGKILRKTSLDETPQLLNVLLGSMSLVGPRPALPVQVEHFSEEEMAKLKVKPGITGWTQVNGRNSIPYEKRMELDVWYAHNNNVFLDIFIMFKTIKVIILGDGVYDQNSTSPSSSKK